MLDRLRHDVPAAHHLAEGAGEVPLRVLDGADVEAGVSVGPSAPGAHHEAQLLGLLELPVPFQVLDDAFRAGSSVGRRVEPRVEALSGDAPREHLLELGSPVRRPVGAGAHRQEVLGAAEVSPKANVDPAEALLSRCQLHEHLGVVLRNQGLQH